MSSIGTRVKEIRKKEGMTQHDFGKRLLVSNSYISKVEADKEIPSKAFLRLLSLEFCINEEWISTGNGNRDADRPTLVHEPDLHSVHDAIKQITHLLDTQSKQLFLMYGLCIEHFANMLCGYSLSADEISKIPYVDALTYFVVMLDHTLKEIDGYITDGSIDEYETVDELCNNVSQGISREFRDVLLKLIEQNAQQ